MRYFSLIILSVCAAFVASTASLAQSLDVPARSTDRFSEGIVGGFDSDATLGAEPATLKAEIAPAAEGRPAVLLLKVKIAPGKHAYSITQPAGGPLPTRIELDPSKDYRLLGEFRASPAPHSRKETGPVWTGLEIQEHEGEVTWYVPIEITAGVDPSALVITGTVNMEVCQTGGYCEPVEKIFDAKVAGNAKVPTAIAKSLSKPHSASSSPAAAGNPKSEIEYSKGSIQLESSSVRFTGQLVPSTVKAGGTAEIEITANLPKGSRIYAHTDRDDRLGTKPVLIAIDRASGLLPSRATTDAPVNSDNSVPQFGVMQYHEGNVTWKLRIAVPEKAPAGDYPISGMLGYQSCEYKADGKNICELPHAIRFTTTLKVGNAASTEPAPILFAEGGSYSDAAKVAAAFADSLDGQSIGPKPSSPSNAATSAPADTNPPVLSAADPYDLSKVRIDQSANSIGHYIALAFVGGLLLNLMPCVLPVIGLKVMSFVEQAGKNRAHALVLNIWFAVGIVAVFLILAVLASLPSLGLGTESLGWGGQFGSTGFNVAIASIVFAMALSLLGVWEVPIPGFFGGRSVHSATSKEGPLGAVLKGVVTTVLATPCTAPFMATAVAWAVAQSFTTTLIVFTSLGLGMASPYILVGVFPELLRFLPKPGRWMETFKQVSGFILLGTVIFILSFIEPTAIVPTIILLLGIAVACWLIARTPITAESHDRMIAWGKAGAIVLVFVAVSFGWLYRVANTPSDAGWQAFSLAKLKEVAVDQRRTVLVDFSAEWCINCKVLEQAVLHTTPVEQAIAGANVVTMYADYTDYPEEIRRTINALGANGVPVIAIFPGNAPYDPIVFGGGYTKDKLIAAIQRATNRRGQATGPTVAEAGTLTPMN